MCYTVPESPAHLTTSHVSANMSIQLNNDECFTEEEDRPTETKANATTKPEAEMKNDPCKQDKQGDMKRNKQETSSSTSQKPEKTVPGVNPDGGINPTPGEDMTEPAETKDLRAKLADLTKTGIEMAKNAGDHVSSSSSEVSSMSESTDSSDDSNTSSNDEAEKSKKRKKKKKRAKMRKRKREKLLLKLKKARKELKKKSDLTKATAPNCTSKQEKERTPPQQTSREAYASTPIEPNKRDSQSSEDTDRRSWMNEREDTQYSGREQIQQNQGYKIPKLAKRDSFPSTPQGREGSPCPSVSIERVVYADHNQRDRERREREEQREERIEQEKIRMHRRVEDIFPNSRAITSVLTDARWCTPCRAFNIGQCDMPERSHTMIQDRQTKHICSICHYAAGTCNSHTARNCKLDRFLTHEVERRREENRRLLSTRTERDSREEDRKYWGTGGPPHRGGRGRELRREYGRP